MAASQGPRDSPPIAAGVLVVDDEFSVRDSLEGWFKKDGYLVASAADATEALRKLKERTWDVVLLDIRMPGMDGLELQRRIHEIDPRVVVIMITAFASVDTAVQALKEGALDYVTKPIDPDELSHLVRRGIAQRRSQDEDSEPGPKARGVAGSTSIVAESAAMRHVLEQARSVADTDVAVMIRGESGTGKELLAQFIHAESTRGYFPIVPVHCGAFTESQLESELFGHEKRASTGAQSRRKGKLEMANGGTLFLEEVDSIAPRLQIELLRALETKEFLRVGGNTPIQAEFRIIAATSQDLERALEEGRIREDLYFRLNVFSIVIPPLRDRREDIPVMAQHFLERSSQQLNRPFTEFDRRALDVLSRHAWPSNVRELENAIEHALVVGKPPTVRAEDLPLRLEEPASAADDDSLAQMEQNHIEKVLSRHGGNVTRAAKALGIDRVTLYNKIKKYGLSSSRTASKNRPE